MAVIYHTVVRGDNLSRLALKYGTTVGEIMRLNPFIKHKDWIYDGQVLKIIGTDPDPIPVNVSSKAVIQAFGLQVNTDRTIFAVWTWDRSNTENYETRWYYDTGNGVWFVGEDSSTKNKQSIYNAPSNAVKVKFKVKPVSQKKTVNKKETTYWTAEWSTEKTYLFSNNPPGKPDTPEVELKDYTLTATLDNLDLNATSIQFQVVKDNATVFKTGTATIKTGHAGYSCTVSSGSVYKIRCRSSRGDLYSDWSEYSDNIGTKPTAPTEIKTCKATSETSIRLEWTAVSSAESYDLEYTTKKDYFDGSDKVTQINNIEFTHYEKTGLETGQEYFFRVRAVNEQGESSWSGIKSVIIGNPPTAPTTWSSTTTCIVGEPLTLYWSHNAEDGSSQTGAEIEIYFDDVKKTYEVNTANEKDDEKTMHYVVDISGYDEGTQIRWRVRTAGVTKELGEWSVQRTVDVYAPPTLTLEVTDSSGAILETLESFPFYISGEAGPNTQTPIGYHVSITSNSIYETVDDIGNAKTVNIGEEVYSKHHDTSESLSLALSAGDVDLNNNARYTITCMVSMNSGLTAEASTEFVVSWTDEEYSPNAEISIDNESLTASIHPFCQDAYGRMVEGVLLSVYRRNFDGGFTELATGIDNSRNIFITDPHPALDLARYRIVAMSSATGAVSYYDIPGYPVGEPAVVIQWDEAWSSFDASEESLFEQPNWAGSMLKLPYNIDVSNDHEVDVSLVEYIGREHPVGYYGTQRREKANWSVDVPKYDKETLYALRRLAIWKGNVYVREPSGSGYWASISVSFNQKHQSLVIPVKLDITRVEGGA